MDDERPEADGAWIFVSHSHRDLKKVQQIRDALEKDGHKPLLFFLKCLQDDDARLPQLIKDEIEARTWFVLCDSDYARVSRWVQEERQMVELTKPTDTFVVIDLAKDLDVKQDGDVPPFVRKLAPLLKRATVYLDYVTSDRHIALQINDALVEHDYRVHLDIKSLRANQLWQAVEKAALHDALEHGFVLLLLSPDYLTRREEHVGLYAGLVVSELGLKQRSNLVPLIVSDPDEVYERVPALRNLPCLDMTKGQFAENIMALVHHLKARPMT